jgi:hypothetical protein
MPRTPRGNGKFASKDRSGQQEFSRQMCVKGSFIIGSVEKGGRAMVVVSIEISLGRGHNLSIRRLVDWKKSFSPSCNLPTCPWSCLDE